MSEAIAGVTFTLPPVKIRQAAVVLVYRRIAGSKVELFWLKREKTLKFAGGYFAFPGGKADAADESLVVTAARELFEETGLLVAQGAEKLSQVTLNELRLALEEETMSFYDLLKRHSLTIRAEDFHETGRWLTPDFMPIRFDARMYLVEAPANQLAEVWPGELSEGSWQLPAVALRQWEEGTALLHPPTLHALRVMERFSTVETAIAELSNPPDVEDCVGRRVEFQRGIQVVPLKTATLPPATHTNCYLLGTRELVIVDPGASDAAELEYLKARLTERQREGCTLKAILATHHHGDHIGGLEALAKELSLPVWSHPQTAIWLPVTSTRLLSDGDVIELQGEPVMQFDVLHTPGHARGHLCLIERRSKAAIVGDMVAGIGTIVIDPPQGDMGVYLQQLTRLKNHVGALYPSHGPIIADGVTKLDEYLAHRAWRESKVIEALRKTGRPTSLDDLVPLVYDDVASFIWPLAERNTAAILDKLINERRVRPSESLYSLDGD